jgi:hypothetical protein
VLRRGTCLWRVHRADRQPSEFKSELADPHFGGSRFDATPDHCYPYWYAGVEEETALCETLLRDICADDYGFRVIPRAAVESKVLSAVTLTADLTLVSLLSGADLGAIAQDSWLIRADGSQYAQTRVWGHWLRQRAPEACGFIWASLRNQGGRAIVLFGDRCAAAHGDSHARALLYPIPPLTVCLDDKAGAAWLMERLRAFRVSIAPPPPADAGPAGGGLVF